jgi:RNA polymerase sigma-70 factor (ECF subfamily)
LTDQHYIQKVIEGDSTSFRFLVDKYKNKAFSVAFSMLRNQEYAEDAVQEAFIQVFKKLHTFRGEALFSTWLVRIVVNESIKTLRKYKSESEGAKLAENGIEVAVNSSLNTLKESEQKHYIDSTLKKMPSREALILQLFYLEELSLNEMETVLDLKSDHIKVILHRARKTFYGILEAELKHELTSIIG